MNILLWGACGRMGKNVAELVGEPHQIVCGVDLFPAPMPFPVYTNAGEIKESPEGNGIYVAGRDSHKKCRAKDCNL